MVDSLSHYCSLVNSLLEEVRSAKYNIRTDRRLRIRDDVINTHRRERKNLRILYGDKRLKQAITGNALNGLESDIAVLESQATNTATPGLENLDSNERHRDSRDQGRHSDIRIHSAGASGEANPRKSPNSSTVSNTSKDSFLKASLLSPFSYVNSLISKCHRGTLSSSCSVKLDSSLPPEQTDSRQPRRPGLRHSILQESRLPVGKQTSHKPVARTEEAFPTVRGSAYPGRERFR